MVVKKKEELEERRRLPGEEIDHRYVAKKNSKYRGYSTGEVVRASVRNVNFGVTPSPSSNCKSEIK